LLEFFCDEAEVAVVGLGDDILFLVVVLGDDLVGVLSLDQTERLPCVLGAFAFLEAEGQVDVLLVVHPSYDGVTLPRKVGVLLDLEVQQLGYVVVL